MPCLLSPERTTIAVFVGQLAFGGAELVALNQARGLKRLGFTVFLVVSRTGGGLYAAARDEFEIVDLGASSVFGSLFRLVAFFRSGRADLFFSHYLSCNLTSILADMIAFSRRPIVLVDHGLFPKSIAKYRPAVRLALSVVAPFLYRRAAKVVGISQIVARETGRMSGLALDEIRIVYNPVIPDDFAERLCEPVEHPWFAGCDRKIVVAAGRFSSEKGFGPLIEAFAEVRKKEKSASLLLLGDGALRGAFEDRIAQLGLSDCVSLPGFQKNIFPWLQKAALFVLPSLSESFGNVLVEALACGTPVVSSDLPGPAEILADGEYGLLFAPGDVQQMARRILQGLEADRFERGKLVERGTFFSVRRSAEAYAELIGDILGKKELGHVAA